MKIFNTLPSNWNSLSEDQKYEMTLVDQILRLVEIKQVRNLRSWEQRQLDSLTKKLEACAI